MSEQQGRFSAALLSAIEIDNGGYKPSPPFTGQAEGRPMHPREKENFPNAKIEKVHIDELRPGDTIMWDGVTKTVGPKDLRKDPFYGRTVFGDSFRGGHDPVERVTFPPLTR